MFSTRKPLEPPSKRLGHGLPLELSAAKRQRLDLWGETHAPAISSASVSRRAPLQRLQSLDDIQNDNVLVATPECVVTRVRSVPASVADEIRRERPSTRQVVNCRVAVPSTSLGGRRGERQVLSYYVLALRQRVVLWQEGSGSVVTLSLPDEIGYEEPLHPFLLALYGARISLMLVSRSGRVLFWEDVDLPYESVPLSVQIPLQPHEQVFTNAHASVTVSPSTADQSDANGGELKSILCWSNIGSVWEVAMEDRRIRVRALERHQGGFLSGLTKTVSQFFFSSASTTSTPPEIDVRIPIKAVKIVPTSSSVDGRDAEGEGRVEKLLLFHSGLLERRSFNSADVVDCNSSTVWHFDANRSAISYFSEQFPESHLAKVTMLSIPYVHEDSSFGVVVAYVCTARNEDTPKVKYALLQFKSSSPNTAPEPQWACVLDYEPVFSESVNSNEFFDVETISINSSSFYLVWIHSQPIHFASIQLPSPGYSSVRFQGYSLQGVERNSTLGFAPRLEVSSEASDALKGSVSFILSDYEAQSAGTGVILCSATASNMARLHSKTQDISRRLKRVEDSDELTPESLSLGENLSVEEYASLLAACTHDEHKASTGPLRISSGDVPNVAQAAIGVAYQILDAKASSGLRWGKNSHDSHDHEKHFQGASVTPKLVRFQLEEKRARFEELIAFIQQRCSNVWQHIESSGDLLQYLIDGEEQLHAAISLCKFQGSIAAADENAEFGLQPKLSGKLLLRAIERAVHQRGYEKEQLRLAGYNAFDIFYCEVSKILEIFVALSVEVQRLASDSGEGNTDFMYALLESGYSMQSLLKTPTATQLESNGSWMFTRPIREVIADQISRLSNVVGYEPVPSGKSIVATPDEVFEIANQISKLGGILLDAYQRFIPTTSGEIADDLRKEADITKRLTLNPLVYVATAFEPPLVFSPEMDEDGTHWTVQKKSDLFDACVKASEQYDYYEAMVFLAYREDEENLSKLDYILGRLEKSAASKRLESYCRKVPDFAEFVYRWYGGEAARYPWGFDGEAARAQVFSYLLSNSPVFGPSLHSYLKAHTTLSKFAWVTATATEKYDHVAHLSLKDALNERSSLSKRKTMASIAKIAALAGPATPIATATEIQRELNIGRIQEVLMELPITMAIDARPLSPEELSSKALQALQSVAPEDPLRASVFLVAVEALECLPTDLPRSDFDTLCISTWRECVLADTDLWAQLLDENDGAVNEHKVESMMRSTLLFKVMSRYVARWQERPVSRPAGLTVDLVDDMVSREVSGSPSDAVINVRSRQLFVKTLDLAQKL